MIYCITGTDNQKRKIATEKVVGNFVSQNFPIKKVLTSSPDRNNAKDIPYLP